MGTHTVGKRSKGLFTLGLVSLAALIVVGVGAGIYKASTSTVQIVDCDKYPIRLAVGGDEFYCSPSVLSFPLDVRTFGDCIAASSGHAISIAFRALTADVTVGVRECSTAQLDFRPREAGAAPAVRGTAL